jgi:hypothetical protein
VYIEEADLMFKGSKVFELVVGHVITHTNHQVLQQELLVLV